MKKRLFYLGFVLVSLGLIGCGQIVQETGGKIEAPQKSTKQAELKQTVVASSKITITMGGNSNNLSPQSIQSSLITSQSIEIEADVPEFMTFDAQSSIFFNITDLSWIEADGVITLNVLYNDLASPNLQACRVRAYMQDNNGLVGQAKTDSIIPLEIKVVDTKPYQPLITTSENMKTWNTPFEHIIRETIVFKLKGDFSDAFKQIYKGTMVLDFVRDDEVTTPPPPTSNTVLLLHMDGDASDSSSSNHQVLNNGTSFSNDIAKFGQAAKFEGGTSELEIPDSNDWYFGTDDFTIDFWVYHTALNTYNRYYLQRGDTEPGIGIRFNDALDDLIFFERLSGHYEIRYHAKNTGITTGKWYHLVVERENDTIRIFINGQEQTLEEKSSLSIGEEIIDIDGPVYINDNEQPIDGYIDEFRISKGIARWTSDFTPPTAPY